MSYILDALRRADAERAATSPAGTGSSAAPLPTANPSQDQRSPWANPVVLGSLALVVLAVSAYGWWRQTRHASDRTVEVAAAAAPRADGPTVSPANMPVPPASPGDAIGSATKTIPAGPLAATPTALGPKLPVAPVLAPLANPKPPPDNRARAAAAERSAALLPSQGRAMAPPQPANQDTVVASDDRGTMAPGAAPAASDAGVPAAPPPSGIPPANAPTAQPAPASPPLPAPAPSPAPMRSPAAPVAGSNGALASDAGLKVTGASYSENPAHRLLIVNGKLVKEGQEVEPGLVLEVISPRSAVFRRGNARFNVNY